MLRQFVHIDLDSFFVSVERLLDPSLNGKPVLIGGKEGRGVVASCSYEARKYGIHSAMPMRTAMRLCPHATVVSGSYGNYSKSSAEVTEIIRNSVPLFEKTSIDEFYIDYTGMDRFFDSYRLASKLRQDIMKLTGLPISFGFSTNKTVSKIATNQAKPNGQLYVEPGKEKQFMAPLSVNKIPMIGDKAYEQLIKLGIFTIGDLQKQSLENMQRIFGQAGTMMWQKAHGIYVSEVSAEGHERKSISNEHTFFDDATNLDAMEQVLVSMTEQLTYKLRKEFKKAGCIAVKIRYSDFDTHTHQVKISPTHVDSVLFPIIKKLFRQSYKHGRAIRLIGVRLSNLVENVGQTHLFEDTERNHNLFKAVDGINNRYGTKTISKALTSGIKARTFNPFNGTEA